MTLIPPKLLLTLLLSVRFSFYHTISYLLCLLQYVFFYLLSPLYLPSPPLSLPSFLLSLAPGLRCGPQTPARGGSGSRRERHSLGPGPASSVGGPLIHQGHLREGKGDSKKSFKKM